MILFFCWPLLPPLPSHACFSLFWESVPHISFTLNTPCCNMPKTTGSVLSWMEFIIYYERYGTFTPNPGHCPKAEENQWANIKIQMIILSYINYICVSLYKTLILKKENQTLKLVSLRFLPLYKLLPYWGDGCNERLGLDSDSSSSVNEPGQNTYCE